MCKLASKCAAGVASVSLLCSGVFLASGSASLASSQIVTLIDGNSKAEVDTGSQAGMSQWLVEGQNQLAQQWFWYRVGNTAESSIDTIGAPLINVVNPRSFSVTYANAQLAIRVEYTLTGGLPGSGISDIGETIRIDNVSSAPISLSFFQYSDFNLLGTPNDSSLQLGKNLLGRYNEATQTDGLFSFTETVATPGAMRGEAAFAGVTLAKLNDNVADNLSNAEGPIGPGDLTWAFQWDFTIQPQRSVVISKDKYLSVPEVPEPSAMTLALLGFGLAIMSQARRSRRG